MQHVTGCLYYLNLFSLVISIRFKRTFPVHSSGVTALFNLVHQLY